MTATAQTSTAHVEHFSQIVAQTGPANHLLAALPAEDYLRIAPYLKRVPMRAKQIIFKQDAPIEGVCFPRGGACALVKTTDDGGTTEVAVVGAEGAIGASVFLGLNRQPCDVIAQMACPDADVLPVAIFSMEMEQRGALYNRVIRYNQALMMQLMQSTACNSLHSAGERCARWLLATHDRAGQDEFPFTHEFAAMMLGLRRPTVTLIAGGLQAAGFIDYGRGRVRILDRRGLESASCQCYHEVSAVFRRLMPDVRVGMPPHSAAMSFP